MAGVSGRPDGPKKKWGLLRDKVSNKTFIDAVRTMSAALSEREGTSTSNGAIGGHSKLKSVGEQIIIMNRALKRFVDCLKVKGSENKLDSNVREIASILTPLVNNPKFGNAFCSLGLERQKEIFETFEQLDLLLNQLEQMDETSTVVGSLSEKSWRFAKSSGDPRFIDESQEDTRELEIKAEIRKIKERLEKTLQEVMLTITAEEKAKKEAAEKTEQRRSTENAKKRRIKNILQSAFKRLKADDD